MKIKLLVMIASLAAIGIEPIHAQSPSGDAGDRLSPLDSNPACMERNGPACVTRETPVTRNAIVPATPSVTAIPVPVTPSATNLPPDQTGDISAGRMRPPPSSGTSGSVTTIPGAPAASSPSGSTSAGPGPGNAAPSSPGGGMSSRGVGR
jgi:hypothetical protein